MFLSHFYSIFSIGKMKITDKLAQKSSFHELRYLQVGLLISFCLLLVGLFAPIITFKKFVLVQNTFSVIGGVTELFNERKLFLFFVITVFSVLLPLLKLGVLAQILFRHHKTDKLTTYLQWMHLYGKWSMLDVFVVAVLVVVVKLGFIASVEMRYGLYAFAAAVLLTMIITARVVKLREIPSNVSTLSAQDSS